MTRPRPLPDGSRLWKSSRDFQNRALRALRRTTGGESRPETTVRASSCADLCGRTHVRLLRPWPQLWVSSAT